MQLRCFSKLQTTNVAADTSILILQKHILYTAGYLDSTLELEGN
jgi:hypothetical protein